MHGEPVLDGRRVWAHQDFRYECLHDGLGSLDIGGSKVSVQIKGIIRPPFYRLPGRSTGLIQLSPKTCVFRLFRGQDVHERACLVFAVGNRRWLFQVQYGADVFVAVAHRLVGDDTEDLLGILPVQEGKYRPSCHEAVERFAL